MSKELEAIIYRMNHLKNYLVCIDDLDMDVSLHKYIGTEETLSRYDSAENLFAQLKNSGHVFLKITPYMKNGSGKRKVDKPLVINLSETIEKQIQSVAVEATPNQPTPNIPVPKGEDLMTSLGLNAPQVFDLFLKKQESERLTLEVSELKADNRNLKEQNEKYREELLKDKYDYQREKEKKGDTTALIGQIASGLPAIMEYMKPTAATGLNAPQVIDFGSEAKNNFAQKLKTIDDDFLNVLSIIATELDTNTPFSEEQIALISKYQLWEVKHAV
jgi:hypothetical protein